MYDAMTMWGDIKLWNDFSRNPVTVTGQTYGAPGLCLIIATHPLNQRLLLVWSPAYARLGWTWDTWNESRVSVHFQPAA